MIDKKNILTFCIFCLVFSIGFIIPIVEGISGTNLVFVRSDIRFSSACSYYKIRNNGFGDIEKTKLKTLQLGNSIKLKNKGYTNGIKEVIGQIKNPVWEYAYIETYDCSYDKWVSDISCEMVYDSKNQTNYEVCTDNGHNEVVNANCQRDIWIEASDKKLGNIKIKPSKDLQVRFCADIQRQNKGNGWEIQVDHIPEFDGVEYEKYAWWDGSYGVRYPMSIDTTEIGIPIAIRNTTMFGTEVYWTLTTLEDIYIYCFDSDCNVGEVAIANSTHEKCWENEANMTGNCETEVWVDYEYVLHSQNTSMNDSTSQKSFTKMGDPTAIAGVFGNAIDYDGAGDYYIPSSNLGIFDGDFTIEFWINFDVSERTFPFAWDGEKEVEFQYDYNEWPEKLSFQWYVGATAERLYSNVLLINERYHIVVVVNNSGDNIFMYVNNTLESSDMSMGVIDAKSVTNSIGAYRDGSFELDGQMDEIRISDEGKSEASINVSYRNSIKTLIIIEDEEGDVSPTPSIAINTPVNTTYWNKTIYANFTASHSTNNSFVVHIYLDDANIYTDNSYSNGTSTKINISDDITDTKDYNITIYAETDDTFVNSSVIFTIAGYEIITNSSDEFVSELNSYDFETMIRYNPDFFDDIDSSLIWNDTRIGNQTTQLDNTTHINNTISYSIPLIIINNTEISWLFENVIHFINGSAIKINSSSVDQNITYSVWINSITTDLSGYITGEDIEVELAIYNETSLATITANTTILYNTTNNSTDTITSYTMTGSNLRTYEITYNSGGVTVSPTLRNITGNITVSYEGRSRSTQGVETQVNVSTFNITNCTTGTSALTIRLYNELDFEAINGTLELIYFEVDVGGEVTIFSFSNITIGEEFTYCIEPEWVTFEGDIYIEYTRSDSPERHYYATDITLTDDVSYIDVYILNSTYAYYTNIYLYDENNNKKTNTLVRILKMNPETSVYTTMFIGKTDSDGILDIYLEPVTQPYMFYVFENGEIIYSTEPETIPCVSGSCPPYEKSIYMNTTLTGYINFGGYSYSIDWDNSTRQLTVEVADVSGLSESIKLDIFSIDSFGRRSLYYTSTTNSSTIYYSEILSDNIEEYLVSVETMQYGQWYPLAKQTLTITELMALGILGILLAIIITSAISMAGIYTFEGLGGLVGVGAGLGVSKVLRLIPLGWVEYAGIWVILIMIGFAYIRNR